MSNIPSTPGAGPSCPSHPRRRDPHAASRGGGGPRNRGPHQEDQCVAGEEGARGGGAAKAGGGGEEGAGGSGEGAEGGVGAGKGSGGEVEGGRDRQGAGGGEEAESITGDGGGPRGVCAVPEDGVGLCVAKRRAGDGLQCLCGGEAEVQGRGGGEAREEKSKGDVDKAVRRVRGGEGGDVGVGGPAGGGRIKQCGAGHT